jgi:DNA-binding transcriptional LysR family regulator
MTAQAVQGIENCENHPAFQQFNIKPKIINLFDSYDVAIRAIQSNHVWALLPDFLAYRFQTEIETYVPRGWDADYTIAAIWPNYHIRTQALDCIIKKMEALIKETVSRLR